MDIEQEWRELNKHLSESQRQDSRRAFYYGCLLGLAEMVSGKITLPELIKCYEQIKNVLKYRDEGQNG